MVLATILSSVIIPICTGIIVSLVVFFTTRHYAKKQDAKALELERKEDKRLKKAQEQKELLENLVELSKATAQHKIFRFGNQYIANGKITPEEKAWLEAVYKPYRALGGNGVAKTVMDEIEKLPLDTDIEE